MPSITFLTAAADRWVENHYGSAIGLSLAIGPLAAGIGAVTARRGGPFDLANFQRREWAPAIEASGVRGPARIYDLRSTFASNALAAGISVFELGRIMGTSVAMIERHYGTLIGGAGADIARRLDAFEADQDLVVDDRSEDV